MCIFSLISISVLNPNLDSSYEHLIVACTYLLASLRVCVCVFVPGQDRRERATQVR